MPLPGEQVWRRRARDTLERDGSSLEGRLALDRDGASLEGASSPRARRNLTRGGDRASSEANMCRYDVVPLERSGVPPEGG
jgi:hypothetical protein